MKKAIKYIIFSCSAIIASNVAAQQPALPTGTVKAEDQYKAKLTDADKLAIPVPVLMVDTTTKRLEYNIIQKTKKIEYPAPALRPLAFRSGEDIPPVYKGYVKLGAGLPTTYMGELGYHTFANDKLDFNFNANHHTTKYKNLENQNFSTSGVKASSTYYLDQGFAIGGLVGYNINKVNYFGYNERLGITDVLESDVAQRFRRIDFGIRGFNSVANVGGLNYKASFDFYNLLDNFASKERGVEVKLHALKWIANKHSAELGIRGDFTRFEDGESNLQNLNNLFLEPSFTFHHDVFKIRVGARLASHDDEFTPFPNIEGSLNLIGTKVALFAGWEGNFIKNNLNNLSNYNPWVETQFDMKNTSYTEYFAGLRGNLGFLEYSGQVGYKNANDLAIFLHNVKSDAPLLDRFRVLYDTVNIFNIRGSVTVRPIERLEVMGTISQSIFDPSNQLKAWHLPTLELTTGVKYTTADKKLTSKAEFFVQNGVSFLNDKNEADNLNALLDLSVSSEYQFNSIFSGFVQANNLFNNRRQRWQYYPTYGINALVGVKARF